MDDTDDAFSFELKVCPKCDARFMGNQHYWKTGAEGCPHDLAGLVCNDNGGDECINPWRGSTSGMTWEKRMREVEEKLNDFDI